MSMQIRVADFFKTDVPSYGAYDNTRKLCSYIDGQKISMRKILYTLMKKYPGKDKTKTETIANICAAYTNYLHGAQNLCGVCNTMTQNFVTANNYPLLAGNSGGFGTRIGGGICAAPRYTKIALSDIVRKIFIDIDENIIGQQYFEGEYIEPKFFIPVFPVLFLNGSHGLSTGFSQDVWPRNPVEIIEYIKKRLDGTQKPRMELLPWFKGHKGKVAYNKELDRIESFGIIEKNNTTTYTITELPIGIEYQKYIEFLDKLCDNDIIQDYDDYCDPKTDEILFKIKTTREFTKKNENERSLFESFHLIKSLPETLCCIDENNRVREFSSIQEILDAFIDMRVKFYQKRKDYLLKSLKVDIEKMVSKYVFCDGVIKKTIKIANVKKDDIVAQLEKTDRIVKIDGTYSYLLNMPMHSVSHETMEELKKQILAKKEEFKKTKETAVNDMWLADLHELKKLF